MRAHARRSVLYVLLPLLTVVLLGASHLHQQHKSCVGVSVIIRSDSSQGFLDESRVRGLIGADNQLIDAPIGEIDLDGIENLLRETNYVDRVDAYITSQGLVAIELEVRSPIARLMPVNGRSFYIDAEQDIIPLSRRYSARTVLVTGHPTVRHEYGLLRVEELAPGLFELLKRINANPALRAQISEVYVDERSHITLLPELGNTHIVIGRADLDLDKKLEKLDLFYRTVAPRVGWNHYAQVDLSFEGQIVGQRNRTPIRPRPVQRRNPPPAIQLIEEAPEGRNLATRRTARASENASNDAEAEQPTARNIQSRQRENQNTEAAQPEVAQAQPNRSRRTFRVGSRRSDTNESSETQNTQPEPEESPRAAEPVSRRAASSSDAEVQAPAPQAEATPQRPPRRFRVGRAAAQDRQND